MELSNISITTTFKETHIQQIISIKDKQGKWKPTKIIKINPDLDVYVNECRKNAN